MNKNLLEAASFSPSSLQAPNPWCGHLPFAAWLIRTLEPKIFVELGTHTGNSYFSFCQSVVEANLATKCYAVDTWQGDEHAGNYGDEVFDQVNAHNQAHYASFSRLLRMTFDDAVSYFSDGSIDLLHIDGMHTYEAVRNDFETWLPKLAPGAVVLFHDTNVRERGFGVWKLWEELQARYPTNLEFVHSHGLGVLQLNGAPEGKKLGWLDSNSAEQQQLKDYFSALGARQLERFELDQTKSHLTNLNQTVAERDGQIGNLNQAVAERDGQIASLNQVVGERDGQIGNLTQAVVERDGQIASLNQAVGERDGQIGNLNQAVAERDGQIGNLNQAVAERDGQIGNLNQAVAEPDGQVASLNQSIAERDVQIAALNYEVTARDGTIRAIESSFSWRLTRPLRRVFGSYSPLGIVARRAAKLVWWALTLQLLKRMREWRLSRNAKGDGEPHFAPPCDDYCFAIPFDYPIEKPTVTPNVAVVCHMYYPEMLEEFKRYLSNIPFPFDLFITTDSEEKKNEIATGLLDWNMGAVEIRLAPNQGRDIAPKLITCRDVYERYEFFLHIHSKKSPHHHLLGGWRAYLLETLLGSREIVESIFEAFNSDPLLGLIAPQHYNQVRGQIGWGWNFGAAKKFATRLGLKLSIDGKVDFPSGSMFWGRSAAIKPLLESGLAIEDFPTEASQTDGTLGHIIERIYFFVCEHAGYRWVKIVCPSLLKNAERIIFCEDKASLMASIKETQYGLLISSKERAGGLFKLGANLGSFAGGLTQSWRTVHAKSDLRTMAFSQFCDELKKHISKQESKVDFDENFYLSANPDVAEEVAKGGVLCGYVHYCLAGQYEGRMHSDRQLKHRLSINPSYGHGLFAPVGDRPHQFACEGIDLTPLPQSPQPFLLILFSHLQEELFFAGYSEFFKDHSSVFDRFHRVVIAVESVEFDPKLASRYSSRIEVMHRSEIGAFKYKPDIIIGFNAHLTCAAYLMLPDNPEQVVYYCQDFESGFFSYGADYIIGEKAIANSYNIIVSTELLKNFLMNRGLVDDAQQVFVTRPKIEMLDVPGAKANRLFFYYRPETFNKRNLPYTLLNTVREFCSKYGGYEIYMVGSVATSYSFKINGTQVFVISKLPKKDYVELISSCDVVVAMIYSAHPGVIAFQAAASGIPTITNVFENRDASLLKNISKNIVPYDPVRDSLLVAIEQALAMPKGQPSFNEALYSGNQQGSLVDFYDNILHRPSIDRTDKVAGIQATR